MIFFSIYNIGAGHYHVIYLKNNEYISSPAPNENFRLRHTMQSFYFVAPNPGSYRLDKVLVLTRYLCSHNNYKSYSNRMIEQFILLSLAVVMYNYNPNNRNNIML